MRTSPFMQIPNVGYITVNTIQNTFAALIVILLLVLAGWGLYESLQLLLAQYRLLETQQTSLFVLIACLALVCTLTLALLLRGAIRHMAMRMQPEKAAAYRTFAEFWFQRSMNTDLRAGNQLPKELHAAMSLWASESVLKTYQELVRTLGDPAVTHEVVIEYGEKVLLAMRKDIGTSNNGVKLSILLSKH